MNKSLFFHYSYYFSKLAKDPFINDNGDRQVPIEYEANRLLQTDSEVLVTDFNLTQHLTLQDRWQQLLLFNLSVNYMIIKISLSYVPNS